MVLRPSTSVDAINHAINRWDCNRSMYTHWMQSHTLSSFLQQHLAMKTSIFLLLVFVVIFISSGRATLALHPSRSIDRLINRSVVMKAPYALTTKSDLGLFSPVTSSDEDITILRGYYCKYQLAERPARQGKICETSGKCASQTWKQKHNCAKHFGWHWLFNLHLILQELKVLFLSIWEPCAPRKQK